MKKQTFTLVLLAVMLLFSNCSNRNKLSPGAITYEDGVFSCSDCNQFGVAVSIEGENLFIAEYGYVYWAIPEGNEWKVKQSIPVKGTFQSLLIKEDNLFIGLNGSDRIGKVKIYENTGNAWEETQELQSGLPGERFGDAIDADNGHLVVGANSYLFTYNWEDLKPGHAYFFQKVNGHWESNGEFHSAYPGALLGKTVAIEGQKAFVGQSDAIYFFVYDGQQWALRDSHSLEYLTSIIFSQNRIVTTHLDFVSLQSFEIEKNGSLGQNLEFEIDQSTIKPNNPEQALQAHQSLLAVGGACFDGGYHREVILFEFTEGAWKIKRRFLGGSQSSGTYGSSFAFSDKWMAIGDHYGDWIGRVFVYPME